MREGERKGERLLMFVRTKMKSRVIIFFRERGRIFWLDTKREEGREAERGEMR